MNDESQMRIKMVNMHITEKLFWFLDKDFFFLTTSWFKFSFKFLSGAYDYQFLDLSSESS